MQLLCFHLELSFLADWECTQIWHQGTSWLWIISTNSTFCSALSPSPSNSAPVVPLSRGCSRRCWGRISGQSCAESQQCIQESLLSWFIGGWGIYLSTVQGGVCSFSQLLFLGLSSKGWRGRVGQWTLRFLDPTVSDGSFLISWGSRFSALCSHSHQVGCCVCSQAQLSLGQHFLADLSTLKHWDPVNICPCELLCWAESLRKGGGTSGGRISAFFELYLCAGCWFIHNIPWEVL